MARSYLVNCWMLNCQRVDCLNLFYFSFSFLTWCLCFELPSSPFRLQMLSFAGLVEERGLAGRCRLSSHSFQCSDVCGPAQLLDFQVRLACILIAALCQSSYQLNLYSNLLLQVCFELVIDPFAFWRCFYFYPKWLLDHEPTVWVQRARAT